MKQFEVGNTYKMSSACDHECVWVYVVKERTASTITLVDEKGVAKKCRINAKVSEWCGEETVYPMGRYSMCPVLHA